MGGGARPAVGRRPLAALGLWRNLRVRRVVFQLGFAALVAALLLYLSSNLLANLRRLRIGTSFDFLGEAAGFAIADSTFQPSESLLAAILVGVKNTALV